MLLVANPNEFAVCRVWRRSGCTNRRINRLGIRVESAPKTGKPNEVVFYPVDGRCA